MIAFPLGAHIVDEALRATRALGSHRYVAGRLHLVHAMALSALDEACAPALSEARAWARSTLDAPDVDPGSRDERLWRRCSDAELATVLESFWAPGPSSARARGRLEALLARVQCSARDAAPFDESAEDDTHPILVDAGWELLPLAQLDADRHGGAIAAFGDRLAFDSARFEEETAIPPPAYLCELPAIGPAELLRGVDHRGALAEPLVVWGQGNAVYLDYVVRGVRRAAKLPERD